MGHRPTRTRGSIAAPAGNAPGGEFVDEDGTRNVEQARSGRETLPDPALRHPQHLNLWSGRE
jgi:hypothetical protein